MKTIYIPFALIVSILMILSVNVQASNIDYLHISTEADMVEEEIALETWMLDMDSWSINNTDIEEEIALEEWMMNTESWLSVNKVDVEADIELEEWMVNISSEFWTSLNKVEEDKEIELEKWMLDLKEWKK